MLYIIFNMFAAWILSLFGFDNLVIDSVQHLFNVSLTTGDYYFIFACIGTIKSIVSQHSPVEVNLEK